MSTNQRVFGKGEREEMNMFVWVLLYMLGKRLDMDTAYWVVLVVWAVVWVFSLLLKHAQEEE